ncbi:ATP-dependent helicase HrpB [Leptospira sp. 96542]|nr:ATP-dependent helicase HrpB [Leptospira sp. 96542]
MNHFPILEYTDLIVESIKRNPVTAIEAPPGTGKTTVLPLELLKHQNLFPKKILILEPRRIAAKNASLRMSVSLNEEIGNTVGYQVRFDSKISKQNKIEVVTDGILTKILLEDPSLDNYSLVIFDEFHERRMDSDLCYALTRRSIDLFRNDLRILIMSATWEGQSLENLGITPIKIPVNSHPLEIYHLGDSQKKIIDRLTDLIPKAVEQTEGDILVFLSGKREIFLLETKLKENFKLQTSASIFTLFGEMNLSDQEKVFLPAKDKRKKIILATNVAESSVTIPGVRVVFDSGFQKKMVFDPESGLSKLIQTRISLSSAKQRAGRSARESSGITYRLWSKEEESNFLERQPPEILEGDIDRLILEIKSYGEKIENLPFIDHPHRGAILESENRLFLLGCLDKNKNITELGKLTLAYPLPIRLAVVSALLPKEDTKTLETLIYSLDKNKTSLDATNILTNTKQQLSPENRKALNQIYKIKQNQKELLTKITKEADFISFGFIDRIGKLKQQNTNEYKLTNGKPVFFQSTILTKPELILVLSTFISGGVTYVKDYLPYTEESILQIHGDKLENKIKTSFFQNTRGENFLVLKEETKILDLVLESKDTTLPNPQLLEESLTVYLDKKDWELEFIQNEELTELYARMVFLKKYGRINSEIEIQTLKQSKKNWLYPFINFETTKLSLDKIPFKDALFSLLSYEESQTLEREAPKYIQVPSGSKIKLDYKTNDVELHVKLQELFGLRSLPKLAGGKAEILIHLLSPARRPVQITKDLESFWDKGYHEVKKELKGRYPKHPWPDKPWESTPTKGLNHNKRS